MVFIPDLEERAIELGSANLRYTEIHGIADIEHSEAFLKALELELTMGYENGEAKAFHVVDIALALVEKIYK